MNIKKVINQLKGLIKNENMKNKIISINNWITFNLFLIQIFILQVDDFDKWTRKPDKKGEKGLKK